MVDVVLDREKTQDATKPTDSKPSDVEAFLPYSLITCVLSTDFLLHEAKITPSISKTEFPMSYLAAVW